MKSIFQLLNPNNTVTFNRPLAHAIGVLETLVYGAIIAKFYYYSERDMLDNGWFYSTVPDLQESTALSDKQQKRCIDNLVKAGLIRCELRGMPAKRSFFIVEDTDLIQRLLSEGEAAMRQIKPAASESYEKKRKSSEPNETTKRFMEFLSEGFGAANEDDGATNEDENTEKCEDDVITEEKPHNNAVSSCSAKRAEQAPTKGKSLLRQNSGASSAHSEEQHFIKSKYNKTKDNNPINQSISAEKSAEIADGIDEIDFFQKIEEREEYTQLIRKNIEYDYLVEQNRDNIQEIDELVALMVEVICSDKPSIRANGVDVPKEIVKSTFLKLNESHIDYVLSALKKNTSKVRNIRNYLITTLYNAPSTISNFYTAEVNHDLYGEK